MTDPLHPIRFVSPPPRIRLVNAFERPFDNAVAAARTCYSSRGIVDAPTVAADDAETPEAREGRRLSRDALARDILGAGHLTVFQHAHFQFAIENVSRHCVWSFLHAHPFYDSEQVSQRYVEVRDGSCAIPDLPPPLAGIYAATLRRQFDAYAKIAALLEPVAAEAYFSVFRGRRTRAALYARDIRRKALEIARYVLPIGAFTCLYHTVNAITLFRYRRVQNGPDAPAEQRLIVDAMIGELLRFAPEYEQLLPDPLPPDAFPERSIEAGAPPGDMESRLFDARLGEHASLLVGAAPNAESLLADSVRSVLGLPSAALSDDDAIALALDPAHNPVLADTLNLATVSKVGRCLAHPHYTFAKRLSHSADSQDQRHRMTPASRPVLRAHLGDRPDYITPSVIRRCDAAMGLYRATMDATWDGIAALRRQGAPPEALAYLLPNAVTIRQIESADLSSLRHKLTMRLCHNAQEEIWRASLDEAEQIRQVHPRIGAWLLPPCGIRARGGARPVCPEGKRYCGVPVWKLDPADVRRAL